MARGIWAAINAFPLIQIKTALLCVATGRQQVGCRQEDFGGFMHKASMVIAILLSLAVPAVAEDKMVVDMSKMTCAELAKLGFQDFAGVTMWLSGYYNASVRNTVIDLYQFAQAAKTVKDYCGTNPRATVMSAAERALGIKMPR
jgi:HdeA/HdeB family